MIIVFEGVDNCGKTTIINRLQNEFEIDTLKMPSPEGAFYKEIEEIIDSRKYVKPTKKQLLFIANIVSQLNVLEKYKNNKDKHILLDRYLYSTIAYGRVKRTNANFVPYIGMITDFLNLLPPDFIVYIRKPRIYDILNKKRLNSSVYDRNIILQDSARTTFEGMINKQWKNIPLLITNFELDKEEVMYHKIKLFLESKIKIKNLQ
ncbi:thymidylate kinase [Oceanotoga phage vB_OteS-UFV02]